MPVLGFVNVASAKSFARPLSAFLKGLSEIGYVDGQNVVIVYRWAEGKMSAASFVADLIQRNVNMIAAHMSAFGGKADMTSAVQNVCF